MKLSSFNQFIPPVIKMDFICPEDMKEIDLETCESSCLGKGCKKLLTCNAVKQYKKKEKGKKTNDKQKSKAAKKNK